MINIYTPIYLKGLLSNSNKKQVVLPAGGSTDKASNDDPKVYKQNLKERISSLKGEEKDIKKQINATQKELNKLSSSSTTKKKKKSTGKK